MERFPVLLRKIAHLVSGFEVGERQLLARARACRTEEPETSRNERTRRDGKRLGLRGDRGGDDAGPEQPVEQFGAEPPS
jgi:hypothetical protein